MAKQTKAQRGAAAKKAAATRKEKEARKAAQEIAAFFGSHPLGHSVLGTADSVGALRVDQMHKYFQRRYSPRNIILAGSGNIDFDAFCQEARQICGRWEPVDGSRAVAAASPNAGFHVVHKDTAAQEPWVHGEPHTGPRIGLTVGKVMGKAHDRNRIKRRMRAAVTMHAALLADLPVDVIMHPRRTVLLLEWDKLQREVANVFRAVRKQYAAPPER